MELLLDGHIKQTLRQIKTENKLRSLLVRRDLLKIFYLRDREIFKTYEKTYRCKDMQIYVDGHSNPIPRKEILQFYHLVKR